MKKIVKNIFIIGCIALGLISCEETLKEKPSSYYDTELIFADATSAQLAMNSVYSTLCTPEHYGQCEMAMPTSDDMYYITGTNLDNSRRDISHYQYSTTNQWIESLWKNKYAGIDRANHVIYGLQNMDSYKQGDAAALNIEGQARFMRALLGFDIAKYWGDAPFKTTITSSYDDAFGAKVSRDSILNQVIRDLERAKEVLPWATSSTNPERPTKGSACGLLMRVYLFRAGYYLPSNAAVGSALVRPDDAVRQQYFEKVKAEYEAFVANGFHDLSPNYRNYWKSFCEKKVNPQETLFEIAFFTPDGKNTGGSTWGTYIGPLTSDKSKYGRANAFFRVIPQWFRNYYEEGDARKLVNICNYQIDANSDSVAHGTNFLPGKWRREWMTNPSKDPNNVDVNFVYLRYADVLLMAAEAYNELNDQITAKELINKVRARSKATEWTDEDSYTAIYVTNKLAVVSNLIPDGDEQGKVRRALYWERGFELCYEGTRKYDLLRWGVLNEVLKATANGNAYIAKTTFTPGKHELFPIPISEIQTNHKITLNNPGFN